MTGQIVEQGTLKKVILLQCEIELLVYKLTGGVHSEEEMERYTGYRHKNEIPAERAARLRRDLEAELRCREVLGAEAYRESRSIFGKIALYEAIFDKASRTLSKEAGDRPVSWAEFRRMLVVEMGRIPDFAQQLRDAFALGAEQLDETGYAWGVPMTERSFGRIPARRQEPNAGQEKERIDIWKKDRGQQSGVAPCED